MILFLNSLLHLLVDGVCAATLFGALAEHPQLGMLVMLYNTLAFSTQCLVGLAADRIGRHPYAVVISSAMVVLGFALRQPALAKVCLVGLGNSVFHVAGGTMTLQESRGKAGKLGIFVAPGCIGLTLGTLFPRLGWLFALLLTVCAAVFLPFCSRTPMPLVYHHEESGVDGIWVPLLLTCAVAVRAVGGSAVTFPWKSDAALSIVMTLFVFGGKAAGGFLCDRLGARKTALLSIPPAAVLIAFGSFWMLPSLIGQLALNLTMPVTLWLLYKAMPDAPGFAFGLAASALWPGTIAGQLMTLTGPALWLCVLASFLFGRWAILHAIKRIHQTKILKEET